MCTQWTWPKSNLMPQNASPLSVSQSALPLPHLPAKCMPEDFMQHIPSDIWGGLYTLWRINDTFAVQKTSQQLSSR